MNSVSFRMGNIISSAEKSKYDGWSQRIYACVLQRTFSYSMGFINLPGDYIGATNLIYIVYGILAFVAWQKKCHLLKRRN